MGRVSKVNLVGNRFKICREEDIDRGKSKLNGIFIDQIVSVSFITVTLYH